MNTTSHQPPSSPSETPLRRRPLTVAVIMLALIGAFYLLREHWGHVAGYWPYLLLLACPVMHLFHGHGHGHHHGSHAGHDKPADQQAPKNG